MPSSGPIFLRPAGFAATAAGGLLLALGTLQPWVTVKRRGDVGGVLDSTYLGVDVLDGRLLLGLAVFMLVAVLAIRIVKAAGRRRALALAIVAAGLAAVATGIVDVSSAGSRFSDVRGISEEGLDAFAQQVGLPVDEVRRRLEAQNRIVVEGGLYLVMGGGLLGMAGGALGLAWEARRARDEAAARHREPAALPGVL